MTNSWGGVTHRITKDKKLHSKVLTEGENPRTTPDQVQPTRLKDKWKIGADLKERDQLDVLRILSENNDRFACTIEELSCYTGPAMEIKLNSQKDIFDTIGVCHPARSLTNGFQVLNMN